jgi:two-component system cell cycle sensor histidine kinase/response regulator CckA
MMSDKNQFIAAMRAALDPPAGQRGNGGSYALAGSLERVQRMETFGRVAAGVAHDFNKLLTVVLGYSDLVLCDLSPNDPLRPLVEEISKAAFQGAHLTRQILDFSHPHEPHPEALNLNTVVQELDALLRGMVAADFDLVRDLTPDLKSVRVDRKHLEQVLVTLVLNARDSLPPGGRITIETVNLFLPQPHSHEHGAVPPGLYVRLAVRDNGAVPDVVTQARWFEPVPETAPSPISGMPFVHRLVQQNGGHLAVESRPGQGTALLVYFPQVEDVGE